MKPRSHYIKYLMDITVLPTGLMLTCGTCKYKVEICNLDNLFFKQMNVATLCEQTLPYLYAVKIRIVYISFW